MQRNSREPDHRRSKGPNRTGHRGFGWEAIKKEPYFGQDHEGVDWGSLPMMSIEAYGDKASDAGRMNFLGSIRTAFFRRRSPGSTAAGCRSPGFVAGTI